MFLHPVSTEIVRQISHEDHRQILQNHFTVLYRLLSENRLIPNAAFETVHGMQRCLSGIPVPYHNALFGCPKDGDWESCIDEQLQYFNEEKMPFVWYVDESSSPQFKQLLTSKGFHDCGTFQGVIGVFNKPIPDPEVPENCLLELVEDESAMDEFNELVCATFDIQDAGKDLFRTFLWNVSRPPQQKMFHWIAKKEGKVVSALSTLIDGNVVSFWNGASLPEVRCQGLCTALCRFALKEAIAKECRFGISYLMADGLAFGICSKLGCQTKWRFSTFLSPGEIEHP